MCLNVRRYLRRHLLPCSAAGKSSVGAPHSYVTNSGQRVPFVESAVFTSNSRGQGGIACELSLRPRFAIYQDVLIFLDRLGRWLGHGGHSFRRSA